MLRIGILQWAAGGFCGVVGALVFVTPHQFVGPSYALLRPYLSWWGLLCLLGGGALVTAALLAPRRLYLLAAHLFAALPIVVLGISAAAAGGWTGLTVYSTLGLGILLAPFVRATEDQAPTGGLFSVVIGTAAIVNGAIMLLAPEQYGSSIFDPVRPFLPYYGLGFLLGGLGVVWAQFHPRSGKPLVWGSHLLLGASLFAFGPPVAWPNRAFTSIAYYNGFGALIALLPWLRPRLRRSDPRSLRTRLALAFGLAVSIPLVLTMAIVTDQIERSARTEAFSRTKILAETLAQGISDYVDLHRAAVAALAAQPGLLAADTERQRADLARVQPHLPRRGGLPALRRRRPCHRPERQSAPADAAGPPLAALRRASPGRRQRRPRRRVAGDRPAAPRAGRADPPARWQLRRRRRRRHRVDAPRRRRSAGQPRAEWPGLGRRSAGGA